MPKHDDMSRVRSVALVGAESEEFSVDREDMGLDLVDSLRSIPLFILRYRVSQWSSRNISCRRARWSLVKCRRRVGVSTRKKTSR